MVKKMKVSSYSIPEVLTAEPAAPDEMVLVANGDLRQSANQVCWAAQANLEQMLSDAFLEEGIELRGRIRMTRNPEARLYLRPAHGHGRL
jgi:hypothetical protein